MAVLYVVRGLPGAGKSTLAHELAEVVCEADAYMVGPDGGYRFDVERLADAHEACQRDVRYALERGKVERVAVANTCSQRWEVEPYRALARRYGARLVVIDLFDALLTDQELAARNVHGVPIEAIRRMRARWHHDLRAAPIGKPGWGRA